ncbi:DUF4279 domain-containing protein [Cohnella terricola]|uniref:DUF4279 domain-containing protein n=1 Tax=Cohnella terricola TaxID=1289167 RepID=A0A559J4H5_9BACL|nr:DUF4279 domain-containing protein [Cohnella terricola]TVX94790.1 DUF4279 domain-containing protein [Cohnella terricola]
MEKTNAKVYFSIHGEEFPIERISNGLQLQSTHEHVKGEEIRRKPNSNVTYTKTTHWKDTAWEIGTEYEETHDLDEQINQVIKQLEGKEEIINQICKTYNLECYFMLVIKINEGNTPAISINKDFIRMANNIGAEIHFDLYANPYKSEFDE